MKKLLVLFILSMFISCSINKKTTMKKQDFKFRTEYHQFYLEDKDNSEKVKDFWTDEALKERLGLVKGGIAVSTESYGLIKGEIEILEKPNINTDYSKYDHVVEGGINIQSGELQILECPSSHVELSLKVVPGKYRVRVYSSNLKSVIDDDGDDYYRIELWKSDDMERKVLKQYEYKEQ